MGGRCRPRPANSGTRRRSPAPTGRPTCRRTGRRPPPPAVPTAGTTGLGDLPADRRGCGPMLSVMTSPSFAELDSLPTAELRERAFAVARRRRDLGFFWSVLKHLPDADEAAELDGAPNSIGPTVDEFVALWRELTGHGYGDQEPLLRAAFIDYLQKN